MLVMLDAKILLLALSMLTNIKSTKLSNQKKCGDPECVTSISRVQALKDHTGPDCRFLNFKTGEEIIVYFKLSKQREDLWAGSKGKDFGYFPSDAVQTEDVFTNEEVEVPTKETDFLCLSGEEYVFENEDSVFTNLDKENEYIPLYTDERDSELKMPKDEILKRQSISFSTKYKQPYLDSDRFEDLHTLEATGHSYSEFGDSKTGEDIQREDKKSQNLKPVPTQSTWTVSDFAGWIGLASKQNEDTEQITFRSRKIAVSDDSYLEKLNNEGETETSSSGWFQSTVTGLLHFGSEKTGLGLLYKKNGPEIHDSSISTESADQHGSTILEKGNEEYSDSAVSKSNWFDVTLSDLFNFGYSKETEEYTNRAAEGNDEEQQTVSGQLAETSMDEGLRKQSTEFRVHEEQEDKKYIQETPNTKVRKTDSEEQIAKELTDFKDARDTFSTEPAEKPFKTHEEQDSVSHNQVEENVNIKAVTKESERKNGQSGWYESVYNSITDFIRVTSDNQPGHEIIDVKNSQETGIDQLPPSHSIAQSYDPIDMQYRREDHSENLQHRTFLSFNHLTNILSVWGVTYKGNENVQSEQEDLKSNEEEPQIKRNDEVVHVRRDSKESLLTNQGDTTLKWSGNRDVGIFQENVFLSYLIAISNEGSGEKIQDDEAKLEHITIHGPQVHIAKYGKPEGMEIQDHSNIDDVPISENQKPPSLKLGNVGDSPVHQKYNNESIYSCQFFSLTEEQQYDGRGASPDKIEGDKSPLQATEMYLPRIQKGLMTEIMEDRKGSGLIIEEKLNSKKLKDDSDYVPQLLGTSSQDEVLLDISEEYKPVRQVSKDQTLFTRFQPIEKTEVKERNRKSGDKSSQVSSFENSSNDTTDVPKNHSKNTHISGQFLSFSSSTQSIEVTTVTNSDEERFEAHPHFSFSYYKHLLGFQSFIAKDFLQRIQENISPKGAELLLRNKEVEEQEASCQKKGNEATEGEHVFNKDLLLTSAALKTNEVIDHVIKDTKRLEHVPPVSSSEYQSEHVMDYLISNQTLRGKNKKQRDREEFSNIKDNVPSLLEKQHQIPEFTFSVQTPSQNYSESVRSSNQKVNKNKGVQACFAPKRWYRSGQILAFDGSDVMEKAQGSDPLFSLQSQSEKHRNNIQRGYVIDSYKEKEFSSIKHKKDVSSNPIKNYFPTHSVDEDDLNKNKAMNSLSKDRAKEQTNRVSEVSEGKQDIKKEANKETIKKEQSRLNKQVTSPLATSKQQFQNLKDINGQARCFLSYDSVSFSTQNKDIQILHIQIGEKSNKEEHNSKTIGKHFEKTRFSDTSLTATVVDAHDLKEKNTLFHPASWPFPKKGIHSSQMSIGLSYQKEEINAFEKIISSSHLELSDCKSCSVPGKKYRRQMVSDPKKYFLTADSDGQEFGISAQHEQLDSTVNNEDQSTENTKTEFQQILMHVKPADMPSLLIVKSQKRVGEDNLMTTADYTNYLQKQHSTVESTTNKNPEWPLETLEVQSQAFYTDPCKHLSPDMPHHLESVDCHMDPNPVHNRYGSEKSHLTTGLHDETFAPGSTSLLPKDVEQLGISGKASDCKEKGKKGTARNKEIEPQIIESRSHNAGEGDAVGRIFGKTSWFLGELFQNEQNEGSQIKEGSAEIVETKVNRYINSIHNVKIMAQESQGDTNPNGHFQEKAFIAYSQTDNEEGDATVIEGTGSVIQERTASKKMITGNKLDLKEDSSFRGFQELYEKLIQDSKRIRQGSKCKTNEFLLLEQEFEKLHHDITNFPCKNVFSKRKQAKQENKLEPGLKKCLKEKLNLLLELEGLVFDIQSKCEAPKAESGIANNGKLSGDTPKEKLPLNSNKELQSEHSEANNLPLLNLKRKISTVKNNLLHLKERLPAINLIIQNYTFGNEREWLFQTILLLNAFYDTVSPIFAVMTSLSKKVVAALPEHMRPGPDLYGFPWEVVICGAVLAFGTILLLTYRSSQSVRSRRYVGKEKQLASKVAELIDEKSKVLEKFSLCQKEYEELEISMKDASFLKGPVSASDIKTAYEELSSSNSVLKNEIECLEKELEEEKSKRSEQDDLMAEIQRRMKSLENETKSIQLQVAEAKTTLKVYEINTERLKTSVKDAIEENSHLHESEKQLLQEAEGWGERFSELNEQTKMFESSKADMEEALKNKESQVKSLTECLLQMKDWSSAIEEHDAEDNHWENDIKDEAENGEHLDNQEKRTVRKLIYAAKLNACLKSLETERNQLYAKLTDEKKAREEFTERIESLQKDHVMLQSENTHSENEVQKLQQKLKVMTELYQENEMNLHRKLTVEEKERLQKEEKLSKVDEKISHAAEELNNYRQRAKDLEDELERTVRSYQNQIMSHEKKAHDNWLTARASERHLNDIRKENLHNRQKLTEAEFKYDLLEKDPYALDVPVRAFGREHSPYGPSPMGRPSSETRAFLSPPTLLEGPLRLSPVLPGGGGRGSRGPGNAGIYEAGHERGELNSDRLSDPHRPPSDTGSLSPPWDRDHRIIPSPAGQSYNEQSLPSQRQDRFYSNPPNSGRLSGPMELRTYSMHSFDKADGHPSENNSNMDLSGNGITDHPSDGNRLHGSDQSVPAERDSVDVASVPPPLPFIRVPLMPMDPRVGPFMRRGPPFPPGPPAGVYGPREYFPRDFAGLPRPLLPTRSPFPLRPFPQYLPPRAGFFPPPPPPLDNRNELPAAIAQLSTVNSADNQELQKET